MGARAFVEPDVTEEIGDAGIPRLDLGRQFGDGSKRLRTRRGRGVAGTGEGAVTRQGDVAGRASGFW